MQAVNIARIQYVDGVRFRRGVVAAASRLIANSPHLDEINVFPVPDGDTGANMAGTMRNIVRSTGNSLEKSIEKMSALIAESALDGAKGNSGAILAQFLCGFAEGVKDLPRLSPAEFAKAASLAARRSCEAISDPKDGTILSVIKDWASHLHANSNNYKDFHHLLSDSLEYAQTSVKATTEKLAVLKTAGVVDAGALGFVYLLEGIVDFLENGKIEKCILSDEKSSKSFSGVQAKVAVEELEFRFCTEFLIKGESIDKDAVRGAIAHMGDSLIVAGMPNSVKIHIHTNDPDAVEKIVAGFADVDTRKVDDMLVQHKRLLADGRKVGILTDSTCDIPVDIQKKYDIRVVPMRLSIDGEEFIDQVTLSSSEFYKILPGATKALTSQPSPGDMKRTYASVSSDYEDVVSLHVAKVLSGTFQNAITVSRPFDNVCALDTRQLSVGLGLPVLEAARAAQQGATAAEVRRVAENAIANVKIFVTIDTLDYAVRGGRMSKGQGLIAKVLNIKPILQFAEEGSPRVVAKSFGYKRQEDALIKLVRENAYGKGNMRYAISHADAPETAEKFTRILKNEFGVEPEFITQASPVLGLHSGPGACAVAFIVDD
ncbi:DAK2 domain-containing protein [Maridesulfovibrio hydrothermalis]|uniref:DegV family protein n=1 Tax=Maridesulfovibrio hydrothermalis AM13 = DSM 14728 TaxID=1121451 RepID=L0R908_9BACT|nr:DegV family protein [Maridesulfovibrio hydrothermalis]CCO22061.1 DegV family protein [Maridesulfovibrio hydrothermalis AM13 = DSM 14728]